MRSWIAECPRVADNFEVIVVDDGSRDRTGEIAERLAAEDSHVKVVRHPVNRGYGGAVISGIRAATSRTSCYATAMGSSIPRISSA